MKCKIEKIVSGGRPALIGPRWIGPSGMAFRTGAGGNPSESDKPAAASVTQKSHNLIEFLGENSVSSFEMKGSMKSIITTYPDFQALPRGVKKMLLASESHFFDDAETRRVKRRGGAVSTAAMVNRKRDAGEQIPTLDAGWRN